MNDFNNFCTCKDLECPFHPTKHNKGCSLCIQKNLKKKEIPSCFFNIVKNEEIIEGYSFYDFAKLVIEGNK